MLKRSILLGASVELSHSVLDPRVQGSARDFVFNVWPMSIPRDAERCTPDQHYATAAVWLANEVVAHIESHDFNREAVLSDCHTYTDNQCVFFMELARSRFYEIAGQAFMQELDAISSAVFA